THDENTNAHLDSRSTVGTACNCFHSFPLWTARPLDASLDAVRHPALDRDVAGSARRLRNRRFTQRLPQLHLDPLADPRDGHVVGTTLERVLGAFDDLVERHVHP